MSFATCSPLRTPASKRSATISVRPDLHVGIFLQELYQFRPKDRVDSIVSRGNPNGAGRLLPKPLKAASSASISSNRGPMLRSKRSPASVGATLRVVRVRSRMPSRSSRPRIPAIIHSARPGSPPISPMAARSNTRRKWRRRKPAHDQALRPYARTADAERAGED